jgi:DNA-binding response OmpR family regulator
MDQKLSTNEILLVEDDPSFAEELSQYLSSHGMNVDHCENISQALLSISQKIPNVIVLDQFVGEVDTISILTELRSQYYGGLVFLSGNTEPTDRVVGLELGADDFISKMTPPREILARLRSLIRRHQEVTDHNDNPTPNKPSRAGKWVLDTMRHELFNPDGDIVHLTSAEFGILRHLNSRRGEPVSRDELSQAVLHRPYNPLDRSIDNLISRLRKKFEAFDTSGRLLKAIRGEGYIFVGFDEDV